MQAIRYMIEHLIKTRHAMYVVKTLTIVSAHPAQRAVNMVVQNTSLKKKHKNYAENLMLNGRQGDEEASGCMALCVVGCYEAYSKY